MFEVLRAAFGPSVVSMWDNAVTALGSARIGLMAGLFVAGTAGVATAQAPTVNGLFYGDGDNLRYGAPYGQSEYGSNLYVTLVNRTLYVCLVVDRRVNDNVFSSVSAYRNSAGWNPPRTANRLYDSEFAQFSLTLGSGVTQQSWSWQQGYAGVNSGVVSNLNNTWRSGLGVSGGSPIGTAVPPGIQMASSLAWNLNNYANRVNGGINPGWAMGTPTTPNQWTSPITNPGTNPTSVINAAQGYPGPSGLPPANSTPITYSSTYQWEWSMIYEWSVDLSSFTEVPLFVVTGQSHHSPSKQGDDENDDFPPPPPGGPPPLMDFGDLPSNYPVLSANNGARHAINPNGVRFGTQLDTESNGQANVSARGDNLSTVNDEDGIEFITYPVAGGVGVVQITISNGNPALTTGGYVSGFMDFNGDGTLTQINVLSATVPPLANAISPGLLGDRHFSRPGTYTLTYSVPGNAVGLMPSRWRITEQTAQGGNSITGQATSGEVEDFMLDPVLAVTLVSFNASLNEAGDEIAIRWETSEEISNVGFHLYRGTTTNRSSQIVKGERITDFIIPAAGEFGGATYSFTDPVAVSHDETERYYFLEDYDADGTITTHGPIAWSVFAANAPSAVSDWAKY